MLPYPAVCEAIAEHFVSAGRTHRLTHLLNLAAGIADQLGYSLPGEKRYWIETEQSYHSCGIDPATGQVYIDRATLAFEKLSRVIG